jgi:polyhydroxyalkanoate synthesis regulator phasin
MTDEQLQEMRSRIAEVEDDFSRRANILLDDILLTRDQADSNTRAIDNLIQVTAESRRDIDQLADRMGELATEVSDLRQATSELRESIEAVNLARREDIQVMVNIVDTLSASIRDLRETQLVMIQQANVDRTAWQAEIQRIWEYLTTTRPNGRGEQGGGG